MNTLIWILFALLSWWGIVFFWLKRSWRLRNRPYTPVRDREREVREKAGLLK
jgi:hypothetical protein